MILITTCIWKVYCLTLSNEQLIYYYQSNSNNFTIPKQLKWQKYEIIPDSGDWLCLLGNGFEITKHYDSLK